jgi:hypothetical protein
MVVAIRLDCVVKLAQQIASVPSQEIKPANPALL